MKKCEIIPGYKGIIDLDLSNVNQVYKKELIKQHYKDIEQYKKEQSELPEHLQYENTIERIRKQHEWENTIRKKKLYKLSEE